MHSAGAGDAPTKRTRGKSTLSRGSLPGAVVVGNRAEPQAC